MKPTTLLLAASLLAASLLAASLLANVALVGVFYASRPASPTAPGGSSGGAAKSSGSSPENSAKADALRAALASGDVAALEAAGLPPDAARQLALGRAFARFTAAMRATMNKSGDSKWWQKPDPSRMTREQRDAILEAKREMSDALIAATGSDAFFMNNLTEGNISFLPEAKRDALRRILSDYQDMTDQFGSAGGIALASDRERLKLLRDERDRDIAAALTPEEFADYQMRTSVTADSLRNRYGNAIADEDEFKKIYTLQKAFDDKFPADSLTGRVTPDQMKARADAALQLQADMHAAVGDDAYAALKRASDSDLKAVDALVTRLNLPADTTDHVAAMRDSYSAESQRIMADASAPFPQRRDQLQALATRAKTELTNTLGAEAADAYAQRSPWVSMLQSGIGFSTTPSANSPGMLSLGGAGPSVYPVMPAGAGANGARGMVNFVNTSSSKPGAGAGQLFIGGGGGTPNVATQIYSITSTATSTTDGHPAGDNAIISPAPAPAPAAPPATPPKP